MRLRLVVAKQTFSPWLNCTRAVDSAGIFNEDLRAVMRAPPRPRISQRRNIPRQSGNKFFRGENFAETSCVYARRTKWDLRRKVRICCAKCIWLRNSRAEYLIDNASFLSIVKGRSAIMYYTGDGKRLGHLPTCTSYIRCNIAHLAIFAASRLLDGERGF